MLYKAWVGARVNARGEPAIPGGAAGSLEALQAIFRTAPGARRATRPLAREPEVGLDLGGEPARFSMASGTAEVLAGPARDPDFTLVIPPAAVPRLTAGDHGVGALGVAFFQLVRSREPELHVGVRLHVSTSRLVKHGYLRVLALGGLEVAFHLLRAGVSRPLEALERLRRR